MQVVLFQQIMNVPKGKFIHLLDVLFTKIIFWRNRAGNFRNLRYYNFSTTDVRGQDESWKPNIPLDMSKIPDAFMSASNQLIKERSHNTAIAFMYLPPPPTSKQKVGVTDDQLSKMRVRYLELLSILTEDLPPTVLVHGIHAVTSTAI